MFLVIVVITWNRWNRILTSWHCAIATSRLANDLSVAVDRNFNTDAAARSRAVRCSDVQMRTLRIQTTMQAKSMTPRSHEPASLAALLVLGLTSSVSTTHYVWRTLWPSVGRSLRRLTDAIEHRRAAVLWHAADGTAFITQTV